MTAPVSELEQDYDHRFIGLFTQLHRELLWCQDFDRKAAEAGIRAINSRRSIAERCTGANDEAKRFVAAGEAIIKAMWDQYTLLANNYTHQLRPHQDVPRTLKGVTETIWDEVAKSIAPIKRDIEQRLQQNHWKGRGADDYMKQLPTQLNAIEELAQYADAARTGVDEPGILQASVFAAGLSEMAKTILAIHSSRGAQSSPNQYYTASAAARANLRIMNTWWTTRLMTGEGSWKITLDNHNREMTSSRIRNPIVLKGDRWPRATKDTTDFPSPGTGPIVDRQSDPRIQGSGRPTTTGGGVDQTGYHSEDKHGRIF